MSRDHAILGVAKGDLHRCVEKTGRLEDFFFFKVGDDRFQDERTDVCGSGDVVAADIKFSALPEQVVDKMAQSLFLRSIAQNEVLENGEVIRAGEHLAMRRLAVTACATDFLLVVLEGLREVEMKNRADIRLVDAHAKGNRRHDHIAAALHEVILCRGTDIVCEARMVRLCADACALEAASDAFGRMLERDIDDGGKWLFRGETRDQRIQPLVGRNRCDMQRQIGAVKGGLHMVALGNAKGLADLL